MPQGRRFAPGGGHGYTLGVGEHSTVTPHTGLIAEAVAVRALVVATRTVAFRLEEGIDERTHPKPSETSIWN